MSGADAVVVRASRWQVYLRLGRVSNLPTVWTDVFAGVALAGVVPGPVTAGLVMLAVSLFYIGGMFLNDAFDREVDAVERPERPIPSGEIGVGEVFLVGFGMLAAGWGLIGAAAIGTAGSGYALAAAAALAGAIVLYNAWHKGNPLGPVLMGICRALVYVTAAFVVSPTLPTPVVWGALVLLSYLIGLTYAAKQESLGSVRNLWPLLLLVAPAALAVPAATREPVVAVLLGTLLAWIALSVTRLRGAAPDVPGAVVRLIAGIALVDALLVAYAGFPAVAAVAVLGLPLTLLLQRYVRGT